MTKQEFIQSAVSLIECFLQDNDQVKLTINHSKCSQSIHIASGQIIHRPQTIVDWANEHNFEYYIVSRCCGDVSVPYFCLLPNDELEE